ncbi:MAG: alpha/beta fold hydrolase [Calditrichaeota bacterium]|nr:MAG: alpha/beta fold hydrolase [Calditrichota bacterium]MBL1207448.1 alpha/beta fold hydrolase [Calditrichota bacterium]NOG47280.1 alpha/beta fold hydrolase [Calditrichota bacterium]
MKMFSVLFKTVLLFLLVFSVTKSFASTSIAITISRNDIKLRGNFFQPEGKGDFPAVILLHGFPGNETDVLGIGRMLSNAGFNVLTFNYSGTYKSEGLNSFENTQKDIKAVYDFIHKPQNIQTYKIDTSRIYLGGYSYGGGMALTYASNHPEVKTIFSIAGTDHGEFMREYERNQNFKQMIDNIFSSLATPSGPVKLAKGATPKEVLKIGIEKIDPTLDLRQSASLLAQKNILLIGGWNDVNVTIDHHILPLYRALINSKAKKTEIIVFQDDHSFKTYRKEVAMAIIEWLNNKIAQ